MHCAVGPSPARLLLLAAALLVHLDPYVCASRLLPRRSLVPTSSYLHRSDSDASSSDVPQLQWQTYSAELSLPDAQTQGTASLLMLNSTTAVAMLELQAPPGFDLVSAQLYNASLPPSSPPVITLLNDTLLTPAAAAAGPQYLTFNVQDSMQLNDLLTSGQAGFRITTQPHVQPAGGTGRGSGLETLSALLKPSTPRTTLSPHAALRSVVSVAASDFSQILDWVQVLLKVADVLVQVGLPGISSSPPHFIASATTTFLDQQDQHERLSGPPLADVGTFQRLLQLAQIANQAYDSAFTTAGSCTAYLSKTYNSSDIVDCSSESGVNRQPYFSYIDHGSKRVMVSVRGSGDTLDWSTDADATTAVIAPSVGAHKGMFASARQLLDGLSAKLNVALAANPGYTLTFTGHSLGAGVSALAAYMIKNSVSSGALLSAAASRVSATCFSTPSVLTMEAAASAESYVTTLLVEDDMVPRLSLGNTDAFIRKIDDQAVPTIQQPDAPSQLPIDLSYSTYQVSASISTGTDVLYQMYAPGTMLQLTSAGLDSDDDSCLGPMLTGKGPYDRLKTLLLKVNMIKDHSLVRMIRCLAAHLS